MPSGSNETAPSSTGSRTNSRRVARRGSASVSSGRGTPIRPRTPSLPRRPTERGSRAMSNRSRNTTASSFDCSSRPTEHCHYCTARLPATRRTTTVHHQNGLTRQRRRTLTDDQHVPAHQMGVSNVSVVGNEFRTDSVCPPSGTSEHSLRNSVWMLSCWLPPARPVMCGRTTPSNRTLATSSGGRKPSKT